MITYVSCVEAVIMKRTESSWMYESLCGSKSINPGYVKRVKEFIKYCKEHPISSNPEEIRCPCVTCKNKKIRKVEDIEVHLYKRGFWNLFSVYK